MEERVERVSEPEVWNVGVKVSSGGDRTIEFVDSAALVAYTRTTISITMSS